jgi:hypothetical protein
MAGADLTSDVSIVKACSEITSLMCYRQPEGVEFNVI